MRCAVRISGSSRLVTPRWQVFIVDRHGRAEEYAVGRRACNDLPNQSGAFDRGAVTSHVLVQMTAEPADMALQLARGWKAHSTAHRFTDSAQPDWYSGHSRRPRGRTDWRSSRCPWLIEALEAPTGPTCAAAVRSRACAEHAASHQSCEQSVKLMLRRWHARSGAGCAGEIHKIFMEIRLRRLESFNPKVSI